MACVDCGLRVLRETLSSGGCCSALCAQWVDHRRFLAEQWRSTHSTWTQRYDAFWWPQHNLPLLHHSRAVPTTPFVTLAVSPIPLRAPLLPQYLLHQLALYPAVALRPSPIHGFGVFATRAIPARTRVLPVFGLLAERAALFASDGERLPSARSHTRLLDVDALAVDGGEWVMDISDACVAGYLNSARGVAGAVRNVRFAVDEQVSRSSRWEREGWVPSGLMAAFTTRDVAEGEELLEQYPF